MKITIKNLAIATGAVLAIGCSDDSTNTKTPDHGVTGNDMSSACATATVAVSGPYVDLDAAWKCEADGDMTCNEFFDSTGEKVQDFYCPSDVSSAVDAMSNWAGMAPPNAAFRPETSPTSTKYYPTLSDVAAIGTDANSSLIAHTLKKGGLLDAVATASGKSVATILASGACMTDTISAGDPNPMPAKASLDAVTGYDTYQINWNTAGTPSATKSSMPGTCGADSVGRFVIIPTAASTTKTTITIQAHDQSGSGYTWDPYMCDIIPGTITFATNLRTGA